MESNASSNGQSESPWDAQAQSPWDAHLAADSVGRPEIPVIGALIGGFVFAKVLKAIGGGDDE